MQSHTIFLRYLKHLKFICCAAHYTIKCIQCYSFVVNFSFLSITTFINLCKTVNIHFIISNIYIKKLFGKTAFINMWKNCLLPETQGFKHQILTKFTVSFNPHFSYLSTAFKVWVGHTK